MNAVGAYDKTRYLVSRFYRAPEVIVGLRRSPAMDIWSAACLLYELHTGSILFRGEDNNDMLKVQIELLGPFPPKLINQASYGDQHFNLDNQFVVASTNQVLAIKAGSKRKGNLHSLLMKSASPKGKRLSDERLSVVNLFKDFLMKCFHWDPVKRLTASQALKHAFLRMAVLPTHLLKSTKRKRS